MTVAGRGRQGRLRHLTLAALHLLITGRLQCFDFSQVWLQVQLAFVGVEQDLFAISQCQHLPWHTANRRQAERTGEDRHMTGRAAADSDKPQHLARIQAGGL